MRLAYILIHVWAIGVIPAGIWFGWLYRRLDASDRRRFRRDSYPLHMIGWPVSVPLALCAIVRGWRR